ncbi:hypothetical protein [Nocardiopsis sp. MG754419]|uniref:hypothetical protein n=1 Tax=Nocardiopsis sp. MG754419 TaxID=2259865 RepID=UPI001BA643BC|nr:hypothetical protein [Nocardiopsis sp. MG754419]MBR8745174.1 hypothetical protein [Nocardiopsis sp. MG754419]
MTHSTRLTARTLILAASAAGFVALGAGIAGAEGLQSSLSDVASPAVERALVEGVAPTMNKVAPEGVGPIAGTALEELQASANDPERGAPDLGAALPDSPLADTVTEVQDATGLDGDPHDTIGHSAGAAVETTAQDAGVALEDTARGAGDSVEGKAREVLPHTAVAVTELRDELVTLPDLEGQRLPELSEAPSLSQVGNLDGLGELTGMSDLGGFGDLTGDNSLVLNDLDPLRGQGATLPMSHSEAELPTAPNVWDLAAGFGVETPGQIQDVVESTELTADNYVNLGEDEVLGMVGNRAWDDEATTVPQSAPQTPGLTDLTDGLIEGASMIGEAEPVDLNGPLADAELPRLAEGMDTTTAEDLVAGLSRGTDLLNDLDTSDLVSIEGGTAEQETPEGMVEHPTFMDLPGSEALPVIS